MHESPSLLGELALAGAVVVVAMLLAHRVRLPVFVGLLIGGAVAGPSALGVVRNVAAIDELAQVGVILLLFSVGLELSVSRLRFIWRPVVLGGTLQVGLTVAAAVALLLGFGESVPRAVLFGAVVALSSTAIVLQALSERGELDAPHGRFIVGILIFQDLLVVPLTLLVPLLTDARGAAFAGDLALALARALVVAGAALAIARLAMPPFLRVVAATRSRELFLLAVLSVGIGAAWVMSVAGLSVALGAFLAGMILADTEYRHRAMSELIPLRDVFGSLFFVSLGLLFDWHAVADAPVTAALILVGLLLGKGVIATAAAMAMRYPARAAWLAGVNLAQFGEFGFVVLLLGRGAGLATADEVELLVTVGVLSMLLSRIAIGGAPRLRAGERLLRPLERLLRVRSVDELRADDARLAGHVVVVGYGVAGRLLCTALRGAGTRAVVLELDVDRVRAARAEGEPVYYGDITSPEALAHARVGDARALVLLINDPVAMRRALVAARALAPDTPLIARTRYVRDRAELLRLGADQVVCDELEAGAEIAAHVLRAVGLTPVQVRGAVHAAIEAGGLAEMTGARQSWLDTSDGPGRPGAPGAPGAEASPGSQ